ncbi:DNA-binding protein [Priestia megaterium]|uniref:AAA family ATPase n=1 Tax=Priestia megaterium TaxID=1404 RepID=UPI000BF31A16|nr:ATP-binding protein [Priestia megaterium]PFE33924.1 DNA-binding protein [Priestia megaterium]
MAHWFEVLKIIDAALKMDTSRVAGYAKMLSTKLEQNGEEKVANKISNLIDSKASSTMTVQSVSSLKLPFDQESKFHLGEIINPNEITENIILNQDIEESINKFIRYHKNKDKLVVEGLEPPNSILLYGPPGCGKTLLAKNLSKILNMPVIIVRLDSLISSFLGSTAKNIRTIFEYAQNNPCILFFDEFDAVAKNRDDKQELGELKRVVNSLLQNIDFMQNGSIIIAATNHEQLLDPAVWRRFSLKLLIDKPEYLSRKRIIEESLKGFYGYDEEMLAKVVDGLSGAAIKKLCLNVKREAVLNDTVELRMKDFLTFLFDETFSTDYTASPFSKGDELEEKIKYIRSLDSKYFTYTVLSEMFEVSTATISRFMKSRG